MSALHFVMALVGLWLIVAALITAVVCRIFAVNPCGGELEQQEPANHDFERDGTILPAGSVVNNSIHNGGNAA